MRTDARLHFWKYDALRDSSVTDCIALIGSRFVPVYPAVLIEVFDSMVFSNIFGLRIKHLGPLTKRGSSLLLMAIIAGAIFSDVMGHISDVTNIQTAFVVPLICYVCILCFAARGYRPSLSTPNLIASGSNAMVADD